MTDIQSRRYERSLLADEVRYRRDRRASIFTWASSLLIAVLGGVVILQVQDQRSLATSQQLVLTIAVFVLGGFASLWWNDQRKAGDVAKKRLRQIDEELHLMIPRDESRLNKYVGGLAAILLLALGALLAIWLPLNVGT